MTANPEAYPPDAANAPPAWLVGSILLLLLAAAAVLRFHQIGAQSLWLDEYWALYLATARGDSAFERPLGVVLDPPPDCGFDNAPHWWNIWTGVDSQTHPPLYNLTLRGWVDLLGDSDTATHGLSALLSIAAVALIFYVLRPYGCWRALIAAGLMTFAPAQIYFAHETRPYALLMVTALLTARFALAIGRLGPSRWRIAGLACCSVLFALTHYLSAGALIGVGCFAEMRLNGPRRRAMIGTLLAALAIVTILWLPQFWRARRLVHIWGSEYHFEIDRNGGSALTGSLLARAPARLALAREDETYLRPQIWAPFFLLTFLAPLWSVHRRPEVAFWWLWTAGSLLFVAVFDVARHAVMLQNLRYIFVASPGIFALLATPFSIRPFLRWLPPALALVAVLMAGVQRFVQGEPRQPDLRTMAHVLHRAAGTRDLIVFIGRSDMPPVFYEIIFRHYAPDAANPIMLLVDAPEEAMLRQLSGRPRIWVLGYRQSRLGEMFPGWHIGPVIAGTIDQSLQRLTPPAAG
jgi:hypothetical protein